jgi:hypothetical protein
MCGCSEAPRNFVKPKPKPQPPAEEQRRLKNERALAAYHRKYG